MQRILDSTLQECVGNEEGLLTKASCLQERRAGRYAASDLTSRVVHELFRVLVGRPTAGYAQKRSLRRLSSGAGVNRMANDDTDGRYCFFVGSDLISLLNSVGIGN